MNSHSERSNNRFKIIEVDSGKEIRNAFVLCPDDDIAARVAMAAYAQATKSSKIKHWLNTWLINIEKRSRHKDGNRASDCPSESRTRRTSLHFRTRYG